MTWEAGRRELRGKQDPEQEEPLFIPHTIGRPWESELVCILKRYFWLLCGTCTTESQNRNRERTEQQCTHSEVAWPVSYAAAKLTGLTDRVHICSGGG